MEAEPIQFTQQWGSREITVERWPPRVLISRELLKETDPALGIVLSDRFITFRVANGNCTYELYAPHDKLDADYYTRVGSGALLAV